MRHRIISLLAQVGYWAGRRVGRREARAALANHQPTEKLILRADAMLKAGYTVYEVCDALGVPQGEIRDQLRPSKNAQTFPAYVKNCQREGLTEAQIAERLGIAPWELRAVLSWAMSEPERK